MKAIIEHKGNQYSIEPNGVIKLPGKFDEKKIIFKNLIAIVDDQNKLKIGNSPLKASAEGEVIGHLSNKAHTLKFHSKTGYKRNKGVRNEYALIKILSIKQDEK